MPVQFGDAHPDRRAVRRGDRRRGRVAGASAPSLGVVGAVIGTLAARALRGRLAAAFGSDRPAAFIEDAVAIGGALSSSWRSAMTQRFDAIIIGAGQAGPPLAGRLTARGHDGRARRAQAVRRHLRQHRLHADQDAGRQRLRRAPRPPRRRLRRRARRRRSASTWQRVQGARRRRSPPTRARGVESWLRGMAGCTVIQGHARFEAPDTVRVGDELLTAPRIFINVGGRARRARHAGRATTCRYLTNTHDARSSTRCREHLVVVGGSYVGLEFAQMYRRFGAQVTVVEKGAAADRPRGRGRLARRSREILEARGHRACAPAPSASASRRTRDGVAVRRRLHARRARRWSARTCCSRSAGVPNTDDLGLERAGVATDERGYITGRRSAARPTCRASGRWATATAAAPSRTPPTTTSRSSPPTCSTASDRKRQRPHPGLRALHRSAARPRRHDRGARRAPAGRPLLIGTRPMTRVGRAVEKGETQGFMKVVVDAETQADPRRRDPRHRRRRGDPRHPRHDERRRALHDAAAGRADPPDRLGADPDAARRSQAVARGVRPHAPHSDRPLVEQGRPSRGQNV